MSIHARFETITDSELVEKDSEVDEPELAGKTSVVFRKVVSSPIVAFIQEKFKFFYRIFQHLFLGKHITSKVYLEIVICSSDQC